MEAVRLMEERGDDRSIQDVAEALGISPSLLYKWRELYGKDLASKKNELGESFAEENARLRRENMALRKDPSPCSSRTTSECGRTALGWHALSGIHTAPLGAIEWLGSCER